MGGVWLDVAAFAIDLIASVDAKDAALRRTKSRTQSAYAIAGR